jgi:ER-bound oxygenase mpaB/B'/Rubber oxygenase, catalytic domain
MDDEQVRTFAVLLRDESEGDGVVAARPQGRRRGPAVGRSAPGTWKRGGPGPTEPAATTIARAMGDVGLFGPGTVTWRVSREGVLLAGGGAALILQGAHPLVAAGVADHSNYREDPWGRLFRTLDLTTRVVFGDTRTAEEAAHRIRARHDRVRGVTAESGGRYPREPPTTPMTRSSCCGCTPRWCALRSTSTSGTWDL